MPITVLYAHYLSAFSHMQAEIVVDTCSWPFTTHSLQSAFCVCLTTDSASKKGANNCSLAKSRRCQSTNLNIIFFLHLRLVTHWVFISWLLCHLVFPTCLTSCSFAYLWNDGVLQGSISVPSLFLLETHFFWMNHLWYLLIYSSTPPKGRYVCRYVDLCKWVYTCTLFLTQISI